MSVDTKINIQLATKADTSGIDEVNKKLDDLQQTTGGTGDTLVPDAVPPGASGEVSDITAAYEELLKKVEELEAQLQKTAKAHTANRNAARKSGAAAEQSAGGIVGAYKQVKGAVTGVQRVLQGIMWWPTAINQSIELASKIWDAINAKSKAAKEAAEAQAAAEQEAWERMKTLKQAVYDELAARKESAREMEKAKVNRSYEERIRLVERSMELEAIAAAARAREANNDYAVKQAELRRDLAKRDITQAEFDERSRQAEVEHNEVLRKQAEENAKRARDAAGEQDRINREAYEKQMKRLRELKEAAGTVYHDFEVMGQRFSVGIDPAKPKIMTPAEYNAAIESRKQSDTKRGDAGKELDDLKAQREKLKKAVANWTDLFGEDLVKKTNDYKKLQAVELEIPEAEKRLQRVKADYQKYDELIKRHQEALMAFGMVDKKDGDPDKWTRGTEKYTKEKAGLEGYGAETGTVKKAQDALTKSTETLIKAQDKYKDTLNANEGERKKEEKETTYLREGRAAEQGRETERLGREAQVAGAQKTVTELQRTAEQQQQAAKAQQEAIDKMIKDTSNKDFKTFIDRMAATVARQSNEGGYRDRVQQALDMFKGYISSSPDQLAGKMDEMTEVFKRVTLPYSMMGPQDIASLGKIMEALRAKAALGDQMRGTTQQQQTAGNNLTEVRDATSAVDAADAGVQGMTNAVTAVATAARALRDKSTSPEVQDDLDAIAGIMQDGFVATNETGRLEDALQSLALADREAYAVITGRMQDVLGLVSAQLPTLQAIPPWAGKVGTRIQQLRDSYANMQGAMATGMSTLP